jgi:hypothetical protein
MSPTEKSIGTRPGNWPAHKEQMKMTSDHAPNQSEFRAGDKVFLSEGTYQGTPGVFLRLTADVNWAEIDEGNGMMRHHPVRWLQHSVSSLDASATRRD